MRLRVLIPLIAAAMLAVPAAASAAFAHVVAPGESLSSVAASDGLTIAQLAGANGLSPDALLTAGSTLMIPSQAPSTEGTASGTEETASSTEGTASGTEGTASSMEGAGSYVVRPGDTLSAIAARAGTSVTELAAANGIDPNAPLLSGVALRLSGGSTEAVGVSAPEEGHASSSQGGADEAAGSGPPYPTAETVTPSEVGSIAAEHGVPPSLAEAIAYQESGFNNAVTSSADARGVMQIMPETWSWIGQNLVGPTPLASASAASNVRAGVLFLQSLLSATGGDRGLAVAGYYQGLESVLQNGEEEATQEYVSNVLALQQRFGGE
jgi:LysM repeat protein